MRNLIVLACPVGMGLMMWVMMRGQRDNPDQPKSTPTDTQQQEIAQLRAELDQLRDDKSPTTDRTR